MSIAGPNVNQTIDAYASSDYERFRGYDRFRFLTEAMQPDLAAASTALDIGCAKGEFIWLTRADHPHLSWTGLDASLELVARANAEPGLAGCRFVEGDASTFELDEQFDVALMSGVLSIFDDPAGPLERLVRHLRPGGVGFVFGGFCRDAIDVQVRFRVHGRLDDTWQSGWNMPSRSTIESILAPIADEVSWTPFEIQTDLAPSPDRPEASFTVRTEDGRRLLVTGGNIVRDMHLLRFRRRS